MKLITTIIFIIIALIGIIAAVLYDWNDPIYTWWLRALISIGWSGFVYLIYRLFIKILYLQTTKLNNYESKHIY